MGTSSHYDLAVVGAGIVGLAHAYEGLRRGLSVVVVDEATQIVGASVRNFGHACVTPQTGIAAVFANEARTRWLELSQQAGFFAKESGTFVLARRDEELQVLTEYSAEQPDNAVILNRSEVIGRIPVDPKLVTGGAFLSRDLQVNPREAAPAIARWLGENGVDFLWRTSARTVSSGFILTSRGAVNADKIVVATNYNVDKLYPELAESHGVVRCRLHMMQAKPKLRFPLDVPLFTGWSLLRYSGFASLPAAESLRSALVRDLPAGIEADLNQMYTALPDGTLFIGDTHYRSQELVPFQSETGFALLADETEKLFGVTQLNIIERWQGVYASAPGREFLFYEPEPGVHVATVTTGIGMTTALGIAPFVLDGSVNALLQENAYN